MHKIEISIRLAKPRDAEGIAFLYKQLVDNVAIAVLPERISEISLDTNTALFVCEFLNSVCGTALVSFCADVMFNAQPFAVVENLVIDSAFRSQGIGSQLLHEIEVFCLNRNCSKIMLLSSSHREDAHRFFERTGFLGTSKRGFVKYRSDFVSK
jgi:N-acetylglutamate synthase-like GNAT family acetyltransferase